MVIDESAVAPPPERPAAPAVTGATIPGSGQGADQGGQGAASDAAQTLQWQGEVYVDSDAYQQKIEEKTGERFFLLPDGTGRNSTITAAEIGADPEGGKTPPARHDAPLLVCPPAPPLEHLLRISDKSAAQTLVFPVYDPTLKTRRRYAGYVFSIPDTVSAARISGIVRQGAAPDVVVLQTSGDGVPVAVVNNFATETIPEGLFRYAKVTGIAPLAMDAHAPRDLVVLEGAWARRVLPEACRTSHASGSAYAGTVTVEFLTRSRADR